MSQKEMCLTESGGGGVGGWKELGVRVNENKLPKKEVDISNYKLLLRCYSLFPEILCHLLLKM